MSEPYIAEIKIVAFDFAPKNYAFCAGQLLSIQQNQALFSILGTTYGGNGVQTFALPDLRSRAPVHWGQGPGLSNVTLGEMAGVENVTLTTNQLPAHTHAFSASAAPATTSNPAGNAFAGGAAGGPRMYGPPPVSVAMSGQALATAGGSQPHNNMQPYLAVNFVIALFGIFPSRN